MTRSALISIALLAAACTKTPPESSGSAATTTTEVTKIDPATGEEVPAETPEQRVARLRAQVDDAAALLTTRDAGQAQQAVLLLEEALGDLSGEAVVYYNLGVAHEILRDSGKAEDAYVRATELEPALVEAWMNLAAIYMEQDEPGRALSTYREGLKSDEENMRLRGGVIAALREMGREDEAIREAKTALALNANSLDIYNNLGMVYLDRGELEMAQFIFEKALFTIDGGQDNAWLHCNLGITFLEMEEGARAKRSFESALSRDPDLVPAMFHLSNYFLNNRNYSDTVDLMEKARELAPKDHGVRMNLGIAYRGVGRYEEAEKEFGEALKLRPEDPSPHLNLGILYGDYMKSYESAVNEYEVYRDSGVASAEEIDGYIEATLKEQRKVELLEERRKKLEEDRKKREEAERLLQEQEAQQAEEAANGAGAGEAGAGEVGAEGEGSEGDGSEGGEGSGETQDAERQPAPEEEQPAPEEAPEEGGDEAPAETPEAPADDGADPWGG